jgi:hypothetical protein
MLAVAMILSLGAAQAAASDAASARAFVAGLYTHYPQSTNGPVFNPTDKDASRVFDPGMVALFREDTRLAKGEVGFVDADPLCQCQDDGGMKTKIVSVTMAGPNAANAVVDLLFEGGAPIVLTLKLVAVNGQWRIHDLSTKDEPSYLADFVKANKDHAAGHW